MRKLNKTVDLAPGDTWTSDPITNDEDGKDLTAEARYGEGNVAMRVIGPAGTVRANESSPGVELADSPVFKLLPVGDYKIRLDNVGTEPVTCAVKASFGASS